MVAGARERGFRGRWVLGEADPAALAADEVSLFACGLVGTKGALEGVGEPGLRRKEENEPEAIDVGASVTGILGDAMERLVDCGLVDASPGGWYQLERAWAPLLRTRELGR